MTPSALQIRRYFVTECHVTANRAFQPGERLVLDARDLVVEPDCQQLSDGRNWEISLRVKFQPGPEVNTPYFFTLEIVGFFTVHPQYPEQKVKAIACTHGPTILYGVARELIREMSGRGPHAQLFLPSVSFPAESEPGSSGAQPKQAAVPGVPAPARSTTPKRKRPVPKS